MPLGDFIRKEAIGHGTYSDVFKVIRKLDRREYVMKVIELSSIEPREREQCIKECRILSQFRHAFIIRYFESFIQREGRKRPKKKMDIAGDSPSSDAVSVSREEGDDHDAGAGRKHEGDIDEMAAELAREDDDDDVIMEGPVPKVTLNIVMEFCPFGTLADLLQRRKQPRTCVPEKVEEASEGTSEDAIDLLLEGSDFSTPSSTSSSTPSSTPARHHPHRRGRKKSPLFRRQQPSKKAETRKQYRYLDERLVKKYFLQILSALHHVHQRRIIHRDLKPLNIFVSRKHNCKLGDFGVSRILSHDTLRARTVIGTPYYLAPELCKNAPYNQKADVWSLGCILYELCELRHPFEAKNHAALVLNILKGRYPAISSKRYSREVTYVLQKCLRKEEQYRYSTTQLVQMPIVQSWAKEVGVTLANTSNSGSSTSLKKKEDILRPNSSKVGVGGPKPIMHQHQQQFQSGRIHAVSQKAASADMNPRHHSKGSKSRVRRVPQGRRRRLLAQQQRRKTAVVVPMSQPVAVATNKKVSSTSTKQKQKLKQHQVKAKVKGTVPSVSAIDLSDPLMRRRRKASAVSVYSEEVEDIEAPTDDYFSFSISRKRRGRAGISALARFDSPRGFSMIRREKVATSCEFEEDEDVDVVVVDVVRSPAAVSVKNILAKEEEEEVPVVVKAITKIIISPVPPTTNSLGHVLDQLGTSGRKEYEFLFEEYERGRAMLVSSGIKNSHVVDIVGFFETNEDPDEVSIQRYVFGRISLAKAGSVEEFRRLAAVKKKMSALFQK